jgi:hypothetical protein
MDSSWIKRICRPGNHADARASWTVTPLILGYVITVNDFQGPNLMTAQWPLSWHVKKRSITTKRWFPVRKRSRAGRSL